MMALVQTRRQTQVRPYSTVWTGAPSIVDLRTRFENVRTYFYNNLEKMKGGELANFDDLFERFQVFDITNTDPANSELYTFEQKLQFWEERRTVLEKLPGTYTDMQPGVHVSPETMQSTFLFGMGLGAASAFGICAMMAAARRAGRRKAA